MSEENENLKTMYFKIERTNNPFKVEEISKGGYYQALNRTITGYFNANRFLINGPKKLVSLDADRLVDIALNGLQLEDNKSRAIKETFGHPKFYALLKEIETLYNEKNRQYATKSEPMKAFNDGGVLCGKLFKEGHNKALDDAMVLMSKQILAVYDMVGEGKTNTPDSLKEKFRDICVYSLICIILSEEPK